MWNNSLIKLSDFNEKTRKNIFFYEAGLMKEIDSRVYKGNTNFMVHSLSMTMIPVKYLQDQIDVWNEILKRKNELDEFFTSIYSNDDFGASLATTIPVYDVDEVKCVRPQYLFQYVNNGIKMLNDVMHGKKVDVDKFFSDGVIDSLKRNVVSSRLPDYIEENEILKFDNRQIIHVNSTYITGVILPFIRSSEYEKNNTIKNANDAIDAVESCMQYLDNAAAAFNNISDELKNRNDCYVILCKLISTFLHASKFMIACLMRKIYIYTANMKEYCGLKDGLMDSFQNGADILHESVIDGSYDFRDEDIVVNILNGRTDITDSVIDRVFSKFRSYLSEYRPRELGDDLHSLIDLQIENAPFDIQLYKRLLSMEKTIYDMVKSINKSTNDPYLSIEDIQSEAGLNQSILTTFSDVLSRITNTSAYTDSSDEVSQYDICVSILNELRYAKKFFTKFNKNMKIIYDDFSEFKKSIQRNDNDQFENHERNREEILFLEAFEKDLRQMLLQLGRSYLGRMMFLEDILVHNESDISGSEPDPVDIDYAEDYISDALSANEDMDTAVIEAMSADILYQFEKAFMENATTASAIVFYEDGEQPAQNQNTTNNTASNNQQNNLNDNNQSSNGNNQNAPKPSVVDNSSNNTNNQNKSGGLSGVIQALRNFISNITQKLTNAITKGKANLAWVEENEETLRKRSYSNVSINVIPYAENISYSELINNCSAEINSWKTNPVGKTEEQVMQKMLKQLPNALRKGKDGSWNESLVNGLKYGNGKVGQTVTYSNAQIVGEVAKMIDYCKNYYTRFDKDIQAATNTIEASIKDLDKRNPDNKKVGNGMSPEETIIFMLKISTTLTGTIANVARDRVNDYLSILRDLVPNNKNKGNKNIQQNNSNNTQNNNGNNQPM